MNSHIYIPYLCPFNFIEEKEYDNKTTFKSIDDIQSERRLVTPNWRQPFVSGVDVKFIVWVLDGQPPTLTSTIPATITISELITDSDYDGYLITINFSSIGSATLTLSNINNDFKSNSNLINVKEKLEDENDIYAYVEFSNFENDFDYVFVTPDDTLLYYPIWLNISPTYEPLSSIDSYEGDNNESIITRATPNDGQVLTIQGVDKWFAKILNHVFSCSDLKVNGKDYTVEGEISVDQSEDYTQCYDVEVSLKEKALYL